MTTTVTIKTHDWPVRIVTNSNHSHSSPTRESYGHSQTAEFLPAHGERTVTVTDTQSVSVYELAKGATGLVEQCEAATGELGSASGQIIGDAIGDTPNGFTR